MTGGVTATLLDGVCAAIYAVLCTIVLIQTRLNRTGTGFALALGVTASWALASAMSSNTPFDGIPGALDLVRAAIWYLFVLHLYRQSFAGGQGLGHTFAVTGLVAMLLIVAVVAFAPDPASDSVSLLSSGIAIRLFVAICQLLLLENLYLNTRAEARWNINLACVALGGVCVYDVVLCADAVLFRRISAALVEGRVAAVILVAPLLALAAARNRQWKIEIHVSRQVAFHSITLLASGIFLLALAVAGEVFRHVGGDWGGVAEVSLIFAGMITVAVLLTSGSVRSHINTLLVTHFFSQRYDYRREWLRCIDTLSDTEAYTALHARVIRAVAQVVDSPGGTLFLHEGSGFHWAGSWNMPAVTTAIPSDHALLPLFRGGETAVQLDPGIWAIGAEQPGSDALARAWLAVPLGHRGTLMGFVVVARSRAPLVLDTEVAGLLRIVGREVAATIVEQRATQTLIETRQLRDYGKRFSFVAHDIKNVSSQLSLLLSNAERHLQNPAFQQDMLDTVRASVGKIGMLLKRLQLPSSDLVRSVMTPLEQLDTFLETYRRVRNAIIQLESDGHAGDVVMEVAAFEAVMTHLLDNAVEAAGLDRPVRLVVHNEARRMLLDIVDDGPGMSPEFIRDRLFQPFSTSKMEGSGIGAFQARELLREAGGDLIVLSEPGRGTTMRLVLPLVESVTGREAGARLRNIA